MTVKTTSIYRQLGGAQAQRQPRGGPANSNLVCYYWKEGRCNRNPCRFLHGELLPSNACHRTSKHSHVLPEDLPHKSPSYGPNNSLGLTVISRRSEAKTIMKGSHNGTGHQQRKRPNDNLKKPLSLITGGSDCRDATNWKSPNHGSGNLPRKCINQNSTLTLTCVSDVSGNEIKKIKAYQKCPKYNLKNSLVLPTKDAASEDKTTENRSMKACERWMLGNCMEGDKCPFFHSWFHGDWISRLTELGGHNQAVCGIALPAGSDKLYSSSSDGTLRIWDCHTGQSTRVMNLGDKIGSLISEGPWIFVGMPNIVKVWNIETGAEFSLEGPGGQVYAMIVALDMLFAGAQDGGVVAWKGCSENPNPFQVVTCLKGHTAPVICLVARAKKLCSGSMDSTIRVWDIETLRCIHTLNGHADAVMSLICWNQYLVSCSLDQTIKVWDATEEGKLEVIYTHDEEHGALAVCGISDAQDKPILICSFNDDSVRLFELPLFKERGRIFSKEEVRTIQTGPGGLFFTGDRSGMLTVWRLVEPSGRPEKIE